MKNLRLLYLSINATLSKTNGSIEIKANNINNNASITAIDNINILAQDSFTNENNSVSSNNDLTITANNNINNHAILSSHTTLSLIANNGNINNYDTAELIAVSYDNNSNSQLILQAINGTINQLSPNSVIVDGDHIIDATDYTNTGRIDISGDLTMNISNDLTNDEGALIYSGNNMDLNIGNNLTNNIYATIYAHNNLDIDVNNDLENISANIESYNGDITINANNITNKRSYLPTQGGEILYKIDHWYGGNGWHQERYYRSEMQGDIAPQSIINSGNNLTINANNNLTNNSSAIYAANDITINANSIDNNSNIYRDYVAMRGWNHHHQGTYGFSYGWWVDKGDGGYWYNGSKDSYVNQAYSYTANIKSGNNISGTITDYINNNTIANNVSDILSTSDRDNQTVNSINIEELISNGSVTQDLSQYLEGPDKQGLFSKNSNSNSPLFETRSQFIDQSQFFASDYFYQALGIDLDDIQSQLEQNNQRLIGDQFFQSQMITQQLQKLRKDAFLLTDSNIDINTEIANLLNNAANEYARLNLDVNSTLTQDQIDSLEEDIIWFETQEIDGSIYVIPKLYLTQNSRDNLNNNNSLITRSSINANNNLTITANSLDNLGAVISGNDLNITTTNNISNNNFSDIKADNNLTLTASNGSIINKSNISAANIANLIANNDIINTATVKTNAQNLLESNSNSYISNGSTTSNSGNINSTLLETANITANELNITTSNDFNNYGANITTTNNLNINATNNINIETIQLRDRTEFMSRDYIFISDETSNIGSVISVGADLNMDSGNDILIRGSNADVSGDANINAAGDLNIVSATDLYYSLEASYRRASFGRRSSTVSTTDRITNIQSNINVLGDINLSSQANLNIIATNLTSDSGDISLVAQDQINILSASDVSETQKTSRRNGITTTYININKSQTVSQIITDITAKNGSISLLSGGNTTIMASNLDANSNIDIKVGSYVDSLTNNETINNNATLNILNAIDSEYSYLYSSKVNIDMAAVATGMLVGLITGGLVGVVAGAYIGAQAQEGNISITESYNETIIASNISANNNINIEVASDANIVASSLNSHDINIATGQITDQNSNIIITNDTSNLNILSAEENDYIRTYDEVISPDYEAIAITSAIAGFMPFLSLQIGTAYFAENIINETQINSYQEQEITQIASNLTANNNINLSSQGNNNIQASNIIANNAIDISSVLGQVNIINDYNDQIISNVEKESGFEFNIEFFTIDQKENIIAKKTVQQSNITAGNNINITADEQLNIIASNITSNNGDVNLVSNNNEINILSANDEEVAVTRISSHNTTFKIDKELDITIAEFLEETRSESSQSNVFSNITASSGAINISSGNNTNILASNLNAAQISILSGQGDINVLNAFDSNSSYYESKQGQVQLDFETTSDEFSVRAGARYDQQKTQTSNQTIVQSNIIATNYNLLLDSHNDTNITASNLIAANDINIMANENINIINSNQISSYYEESMLIDAALEFSIGSNISQGFEAITDLRNVNLSRIITGGTDLVAEIISGNSFDASLSGNEESINSSMRLVQALQYIDQGPSAKPGISLNLQIEGSDSQITSSNSLASLLMAGNDLDLTTNNQDISIIGSQIDVQHNININTANNLEILASQNNTNSSSSSFALELDIVVFGLGAANIDLSMSNSKSLSSLNNNAVITANNDIYITTNNDIDIIGANLLARNDLNIFTGNNLNIESLQDSYNSDSDSFAIGFGGSGVDSFNGDASIVNSKSTRRWVSDQTSLIAQNSVTINTSNNTNLLGGIIANKKSDGTDGSNLTINTASLTYQNIEDKNKSRNATIGAGYGEDNSTGSQQSGSFSFSYSSYDVEQLTKATIGGGVISVTGANSDINNLNRDIFLSQELTKSQIVDEVSGSVIFFSEVQERQHNYNEDGTRKTFEQKLRTWLRPDRVMTDAVNEMAISEENIALINTMDDIQYNIDIYGGDLIEDTIIIASNKGIDNVRFVGESMEVSRLAMEKHTPWKLGYALSAPISLVEGTIFTFFETNGVNGSQAYRVDEYGHVFATNDLTKTKFYNVNGIMTPEEVAKMNYINKSENDDLTIRHNPSHGFFGDLVESGIGKATNLIGASELVAMNNIVADDLYQRRDIFDSINTFHSQGTIIGTGAIQLYGESYQYYNPINPNQIFNAVGPAVLEEDWRSVIKSNLNIKKINIGYEHNDKDPVRYLTAPSNLLGYQSSVYIPNPIDFAKGILNINNISSHHSVTNDKYMEHFAGPQLLEKIHYRRMDQLVSSDDNLY